MWGFQSFIKTLRGDLQVLLISGGENLDPNARVCSYSSGTDTNPIFLFSKSTIESSNPPAASIDIGCDSDLKEQVEGSLNMPPAYNTVVVRAQLAQHIHDLAREQVTLCEQLVHDQHLQQLGWAAVIANLEDISSAFKARANLLRNNFKHYIENRASQLEILHSFADTLSLLGKIPVMPSLLEARGSHSGDSGVSASSKDPSQPSISLLEWISSKDNQRSLDQLAELCLKGLAQFNTDILNTIEQDVNATLEAVNNQNMKEVKGLGDRLFGLEQLMSEAKKIVQEQADMAQSFLQNQTRASHLRDTSVLPDLCNSHRKQLLVMLKNHQQLRDIRRRCMLAKEELSVNLHARLRWVMYVEKSMCDVDGKLIIYHENLKRLGRHLNVVKQVHDTPYMYTAAVVEVVRRKQFSQEFLKWAGMYFIQVNVFSLANTNSLNMS